MNGLWKTEIGKRQDGGAMEPVAGPVKVCIRPPITKAFDRRSNG